MQRGHATEFERISGSGLPFGVAALSCIVTVGVSVGVFFLAPHGGASNSREGGEAMLVVVGLGALTTIWSAVIVLTVFLPVMRALDSVTRGASQPWLFGVAGVAALPLAVVVFVAVSKIVPGNERSMLEQLRFMVQDPGRFAPLLVGWCAGGSVFGVSFARKRHASLS